ELLNERQLSRPPVEAVESVAPPDDWEFGVPAERSSIGESFKRAVSNMRFTKMQGCGNDYIYVNCFREKPPKDAAALSQAISDRHFAVGADGLILICPSE